MINRNISKLASFAAVNVDSYIRGKTQELRSLEEFASSLRYAFASGDIEPVYIARAMQRNSTPELKTVSDLEREVGVLLKDIDQFKDVSEDRQKFVLQFLNDTSRVFGM